MNKYKSPYEAYPFLSDKADNLMCDFELMTDMIASKTGLLASKMQSKELKDELLRVCELIYHANASLRTKRFTITDEEFEWLLQISREMQKKYRCEIFVLTAGCEEACVAHELRVYGKMLVRLLYRHAESTGETDTRLVDFCNILSGYFFSLALRLNDDNGVSEIEFISRNYQ